MQWYVFMPLCNAGELTRVIAQDGYIITVTPAPRHLYQLKALIYSTVHLHPLKDEIFCWVQANSTASSCL